MIKKSLLGAVIGAAAITPGVSGGVVAVSFGIYEEILNSVSLIAVKPLKALKFLFPYILGGVIGIILTANVLSAFFANSRTEMLYIFIGLIGGTIPYYIKDSNKKGFKYIYPFISIAVFLVFTGFGKISFPEGTIADGGKTGLIISGCILSVGTVIPGLSSSMILMKFGLYSGYLDAVSNMKMYELMFIALGFIITTIAITKAVTYLYKHFHGMFSYAVFGLLLASVVMMFPGLRTARYAVVDISLMYMSFVMSFLIMSFRRPV